MSENTENKVININNTEINNADADSVSNKIAVKDFVKKYNALTSDKLKESQIDNIIKYHYAPILRKKAAADLIVKNSIQEKDGIEYIDSFLSQVGLMSAIVSLYTNLDCSGNVFDNYDLLMETGIYPIILYKVGEKDIKEFMSIFASVEETFVRQQSFESYIAKQITRFGELFGGIAGSGLESLSTVLNNEEKMKDLIGKLPKIDNVENLLKMFNKNK